MRGSEAQTLKLSQLAETTVCGGTEGAIQFETEGKLRAPPLQTRGLRTSEPTEYRARV